MILSFILASAVVSSPMACQLAYRDLQDWEGQAYGVITRKEVDQPGGYMEHDDVVAIRTNIHLAAKPYEEEIRIEALSASPERCRYLSQAGKYEINRVIIALFG